MRPSMLAFFLILSSTPGMSQTVDRPKTLNADDPEQAVQLALNQLSGGTLTKVHAILARHGDACAVALTKIVAGQKPSAKETENMIVVIRMAFGRPVIVEFEPDRQPRTTLFVLQYFEAVTTDAKLKRKIAETRQYVVEQAKKASKSQ